MIFPTESDFQFRRSLMAQVAAGDISELQGLHEALRAEPDYADPLRLLALNAEEDGDLVEAERYARDLIRVHPNGHEGFLILARLLEKGHPGNPLARGYLQLGLAKMQFDDESAEPLDAGALAEVYGVGDLLKGVPSEQAFIALTGALESQCASHPPEIEQELRPHRLVHELRECRDEVLDPAVVDGIIENAQECAPLLLGILQEFGAEQLTDDDYRVVERALVLLGEIGDPAVLPAITEFLTLNEEDLSGPADWAFRRISLRRTAETLEKICRMLPAAGAPERVVLAQQIALAPKSPGRAEALSILTQGIERFPKAEREAVVFGAIAGFYLVEGGASPQAASLERQYAGSFSKDARSDLRELRKEVASLELGDASLDELTVYAICCQEPDFAAEDDDVETVEKEGPRPGRNEPCWCGSGKKYKKCHLDEDQRT